MSFCRSMVITTTHCMTRHHIGGSPIAKRFRSILLLLLILRKLAVNRTRLNKIKSSKGKAMTIIDMRPLSGRVRTYPFLPSPGRLIFSCILYHPNQVLNPGPHKTYAQIISPSAHRRFSDRHCPARKRRGTQKTPLSQRDPRISTQLDRDGRESRCRTGRTIG